MKRWILSRQVEIGCVGSTASVRTCMLRDGVICNLRAVAEAAGFLKVKFAVETRLPPLKKKHESGLIPIAEFLPGMV
jgi:hypothetical protein